MAGFTADQIVERIANANGEEPTAIRHKIEKVLQKMIADTNHPCSSKLADRVCGSKPTMDELVVALEYELYDAMMPVLPGWEWDGEGYRNIGLLRKNSG